MRVDPFQDPGRDLVLFQQMANVRDGALFGMAPAGSKGQTGASRPLRRGLSPSQDHSSAPVRHQVHPRHRLERTGQAAAACARVERFDQTRQRPPRHYLVHLGQEARAASSCACPRTPHHRRSAGSYSSIISSHSLYETTLPGTCSEIPYGPSKTLIHRSPRYLLIRSPPPGSHGAMGIYPCHAIAIPGGVQTSTCGLLHR